MSDPFEVIETLADPELRRHAPLDGVVAVVDAAQMADPDPAILPLAQRQAASAGLVLLNKSDLADAGEAAETCVRSLSATVPILCTQHAAAPLPALFGIGLGDALPADGAAQPQFESTTLRSGDPISLHALHALLADLPTGVFRVKGTVNLAEKPQHRCLLQVSGAQASVTVGHPWSPKRPETCLVFIGLKGSIDETSIRRRLSAGLRDTAWQDWCVVLSQPWHLGPARRPIWLPLDRCLTSTLFTEPELERTGGARHRWARGVATHDRHTRE